MSPKIPFKWTDDEQKAFEEIKNHITAESLLTYPNFNKPFDVYLGTRMLATANLEQLSSKMANQSPISHAHSTQRSAEKLYYY